MMRYAMILTIGALLASLPVLGGCDREVARETEVEVQDDGTVTKEERRVTEEPDGTIRQTEEKTVDRP